MKEDKNMIRKPYVIILNDEYDQAVATGSYEVAEDGDSFDKLDRARLVQQRSIYPVLMRYVTAIKKSEDRQYMVSEDAEYAYGKIYQLVVK